MQIFPNFFYICNLGLLVWVFCADGDSNTKRSQSGKTVSCFSIIFINLFKHVLDVLLRSGGFILVSSVKKRKF